MSTPEETQAQVGATVFTELFRRYAKIETAQEQLSGVTGRRHSLATSITSLGQQLAALQSEIARLETEDTTLAAEQTNLEAWLSVNTPADGISLEEQVSTLVTSLSSVPPIVVQEARKLPGRGRFEAIESELQRSGWAEDGTGLTYRDFSSDENAPSSGYVYVQLKANEVGPILTEAGEQILIVGVAMSVGSNEHELRSDLRRKVLDDLNGPAVEIVSRLNAKADELIHAALSESRGAVRDSRSPSDDLREVFQEANCDSRFVAPAVLPAGTDAHAVVGHLDDMPGFDDSGILANEIDEVQGFGGPDSIPEAAYDEIPGFADDVGQLTVPVVQEAEPGEYQFNF